MREQLQPHRAGDSPGGGFSPAEPRCNWGERVSNQLPRVDRAEGLTSLLSDRVYNNQQHNRLTGKNRNLSFLAPKGAEHNKATISEERTLSRE